MVVDGGLEMTPPVPAPPPKRGDCAARVWRQTMNNEGNVGRRWRAGVSIRSRLFEGLCEPIKRF